MNNRMRSFNFHYLTFNDSQILVKIFFIQDAEMKFKDIINCLSVVSKGAKKEM